MAGIYQRLGVGTRGSADLMAYITRPTATRGSVDALAFQAVPPMVPVGPEYGSVREALVEWARQRAEEEAVRRRTGGGRTRSFYWVTLSHHAPVPGEVALAMAAEYLAVGFPLCPAVAALHLDTAHVHTHLWIDARQYDGRKVTIGRARFERLTVFWGDIYGRQHGWEVVREHERRLAETRAWRREYALARRMGREAPPVPERDVRRGAERFVERERRRYGDEGGVGNDQRAVAGGDRMLTDGEYALDRASRAADRAAGAIDGLDRALGALHRAADRERMIGRWIEMDTDSARRAR